MGWRIVHCGVWQQVGVVGSLRVMEVVGKFTELEERELGVWGKLTGLELRRLADKLEHSLLWEGMGRLITGPRPELVLVRLVASREFIGELVAGGNVAW